MSKFFQIGLLLTYYILDVKMTSNNSPEEGKHAESYKEAAQDNTNHSEKKDMYDDFEEIYLQVKKFVIINIINCQYSEMMITVENFDEKFKTFYSDKSRSDIQKNDLLCLIKERPTNITEREKELKIDIFTFIYGLIFQEFEEMVPNNQKIQFPKTFYYYEKDSENPNGKNKNSMSFASKYFSVLNPFSFSDFGSKNKVFKKLKTLFNQHFENSIFNQNKKLLITFFEEYKKLCLEYNEAIQVCSNITPMKFDKNHISLQWILSTSPQFLTYCLNDRQNLVLNRFKKYQDVIGTTFNQASNFLSYDINKELIDLIFKVIIIHRQNFEEFFRDFKYSLIEELEFFVQELNNKIQTIIEYDGTELITLHNELTYFFACFNGKPDFNEENLDREMVSMCSRAREILAGFVDITSFSEDEIKQVKALFDLMYKKLTLYYEICEKISNFGNNIYNNYQDILISFIGDFEISDMLFFLHKIIRMKLEKEETAAESEMTSQSDES